MNDDDYGRRLLSPLLAEPPAATRIDVAGAMRVGRRSRRTRIWSLISGLTAVVAAGATGGALALTAPAHPQPDLPIDPAIPVACTAALLPAGGARAAVTGGDPSGTYLVGTTNPDTSGEHAVLVWRDGELVATVPQTGRPAVMSDINASGVAVGSTQMLPYLPYVYRAGRVSRIAGTGRATAVNNAGMIAGTWEPSLSRSVPMRWAGPGAQPEVMELPPGTLGGRSYDIAEDGTIAVRLSTKTFIEQTYLWLPDGMIRPVEAPPAGNGRTNRFGSAYFRFGWLYGDVETYEPKGPARSGPPDGVPTRGPDDPEGGYLSTDAGYRYHVASGTWQKLTSGQSFDVSTPYLTREAFIGRQLYTFPEPAAKLPDDGYLITAVSDDGRTAGGEILSEQADVNHRQAPIRWTCA